MSSSSSKSNTIYNSINSSLKSNSKSYSTKSMLIDNNNNNNNNHELIYQLNIDHINPTSSQSDSDIDIKPLLSKLETTPQYITISLCNYVYNIHVYKYYALLLSLSFCLIFLSFMSSQAAQTSLDNKNSRSNALGVLYAVFTCTNLIAAYIVNIVGMKWCLFLSGLTYALYVASNITFAIWSIYTVSVIIGFGAAVIWCAQGGYITKLSQAYDKMNQLSNGSSLGMFNGLFWSIFQMNQVLGNGLVAYLHYIDMSSEYIYAILSIICLCGCLILLMLKDPETNFNHDVAKPVNIFDTILLWGDYKLIFLSPLFILSGLASAFMFGDFPALIANDTTKFSVLAVLGASDAFFSYVLGKTSDTFGRYKIILVGYVSFGVVFLLFVFQDSYSVPLYFAFAIMMGLGDAAFNTQIYAVLGGIWPKQSELAVANFKLVQSLFTSIGFLIITSLTLVIKLQIALSFVGLSFITLSILHMNYHSINQSLIIDNDNELDRKIVD